MSAKSIAHHKFCLNYLDLAVDRMLEQCYVMDEKVKIYRWGGFLRGFLSGLICQMEIDLRLSKMKELEDRLP